MKDNKLDEMFHLLIEAMAELSVVNEQDFGDDHDKDRRRQIIERIHGMVHGEVSRRLMRQ